VTQPSLRLLPGLLFLLTWSATVPLQAQPFWSQFRGPNGQGVSEKAHPPTAFSPTEDVIWSAEIPPGHSSPSIWGGQIFLSTFEDGKLQCRAYDRANGKLLWSRDVPASNIEHTHDFSNPAAPTAAADGQRVVFYFGSFGLMCFSHEGKELWRKELPAPVSRGKYGSSSSPILFHESVIQNLDTDSGGSRLLAFKISTGEPAWETPRPFYTAGWSTPAIWDGEGQPAIVVLGSRKLAAYDPVKGTELWTADGFPVETVPSIAIGDGLIFAGAAGMGGRSNPEFEGVHWSDMLALDDNHDGKLQKSEIPAEYKIVQRPELPKDHPGRVLPFPFIMFFDQLDKNKDGAVTEEEWNANMSSFFSRFDNPTVTALRPVASKTNAEASVAWKRSRGVPEIPTPLYYDHKLFIVRDGGLLQCLEAASGTVLYDDRVGAGGGYASSPVAADGRVYLSSESGTITVVDARAKQLKVLARNIIGEKITATPALVENVIYVRTDRHLFAFGRKGAGPAKDKKL
jgi:outer membrane protein assembly factor BamB